MKTKNLIKSNPYYEICQILKKIGVGKKDNEVIKYLSATAIIFSLTEKLYEKIISENDFLSSLKFLNTTDKNCKDILNKVKKEVFPLLELEKQNEENLRKDFDDLPKLKPPIGVEKILKGKSSNFNESKILKEEEEINIQDIKDDKEELKDDVKINKNKSDTYREPIE